MSFNGSGLFIVNSTGQPVSANTLIESSVFNAFTADLATALSTAICKDGQTTITANLPMAGYRHTGVGNASARTMYSAAGQVQDGSLCYGTVGGTADVITLTLTPAITAYAAGQKFSFLSSGANTTNVTINVSTVGAKAITKNGTIALAAGEIQSGMICVVEYDGTQFQLINYRSAILGANTFTGLQQLDYSSDIASGATVDLGTATGNSVTVTHSSGTTAITSFGGAATVQKGGIVAVIPSISGGTLTVTHHATNMILLGGANITMASGDVLLMMKNHDSNAEWKHVGGWKADGTAWVASLPSGGVVQRVEATPYTTFSTTTTAIPNDDTIPQNTEGGEYITATITPTNSSNRLVIEAHASAVSTDATGTVAGAIFQDSTADALAASQVTIAAVNYMAPLLVRHEMSAGTTSATTFKLRIGPSAGRTAAINGATSGRTLGGVNAVRLSVTEIKV